MQNNYNKNPGGDNNKGIPGIIKNIPEIIIL